MMSVLLFAGFIALMVGGGWLVSRITGARARFLDTWPFAADETVIWRDDGADLIEVPQVGGSTFYGGPRFHRSPALATTRRIFIASKTLRGRPMVKYVLLPGGRTSDPAEASALGRIDRGLFKLGYSVVAVAPEARLEEHYIALSPLPGFASSANLAEIRIYSDAPEGFRAPGPRAG
jgi:hypothetical protein